MKKKISFKDIYENPLVFLVSAYPYMLAVIVAVGVIFLANKNAVYFNRVPALMLDSTAQVTELEVKEPSTAAAVDLEQIKNPTDQLLKEGQSLYQTSCQSCHGETGKGDGAGGVALDPPPRDFTAGGEWTKGRSFYDMYLTIQNGIPGTGMVAYDYLSPADRIGTILYIRQEFMPDPPVITDEEITQLDDEFKLSQGTEVPGTIPVKFAVNIINSENSSAHETRKNAFIKFDNTNKTPGGKIFEKVITDPHKALNLLVHLEVWNTSKEQFYALAEAGALEAGFKPSLFLLDSAEAEILYNYILTLFGS